MATQVMTYSDSVQVSQHPGVSDNYAGVASRFPGADYYWGDGTDVSEADIYHESINQAIGAAANIDLDLNSLANGPGGATQAFAEIRALFVNVRAGGGFLGGNPTDVWTALLETSGDRLVLGVGAYRFVAPTDGLYPVTGTDKILRLTAGGSGMTIDLLIIGASA